MSEESKVIRDSSIYVSWVTRQGLNYVSRAIGMENPDQLAEKVITQWLTEKHPTVMAHMEKRSKEDKDFRETLKLSIGQKPPF